MRMSTQIAASILIGLLWFSNSVANDPLLMMPHPQDRTSMWWADGFPSHSPHAKWQRCIQTGYYGFVLDTQSLAVPHFGSLHSPTDEVKAGTTLQRLPPAQLTLRVEVDGKSYRCTQGGAWSRFGGPRLIESGQFLQRADITDLVFVSDHGEPLNVEARFETVAWPDRLGLVLAARPGRQPIKAGDHSFGRVGGGFGLDGTNHFEVAHPVELDSEKFTLELWAFVPKDFRASEKTFPWLVCKGANEATEGNFGIVIVNGVPQARLNTGRGSENTIQTDATGGHELQFNAWNHLAISYDRQTLRLYLNGKLAGQTTVGRPRVPNGNPITFGRRQDNFGDGYHFRGVIDEVNFYNRALNEAEIQKRFDHPAVSNSETSNSETSHPSIEPTRQWCFRDNGTAAMNPPRERWKIAALEVELQSPAGVLNEKRELPADLPDDDWKQVSLAIAPAQSTRASMQTDLEVRATEQPSDHPLLATYDSTLGCHRISLDGIDPILPQADHHDPSLQHNNAMERVRLFLSNSADTDQVARLMFEKTSTGFRHRFGAAITGISAIIRDRNGEPTGIPIQLSKNWHIDPGLNNTSAGVYSGQWLHAITQVRLPAKTNVELELSIVYGHWGGVAAASHSQLSLIGWGSNQLWHQSALGSWGESICYEPDQVQANCTITDVRPVMVRSMNGKKWTWTSNVGGGDFFRFFGADKNRVPHSEVKSTHHRSGPCLTEVTYDGRIGDTIKHSVTVSLARTDDLVRGVYRLRMDVKKATPFTRLAIFQVGADTYNSTHERKFAIGDQSGVLEEWNTQGGGDVYRGQPIQCTGQTAWASLHQASQPAPKQGDGAWANRGIVIRSWKAQLGGKTALPWMAEHGVSRHGQDSSTLDIVPPPNTTQLEPGDFIEATIEHIVMPQFADDYYGPNESLRSALAIDSNTWKMIHREAIGNDRHVQLETGKLVRVYPDVCIVAENDNAEFTLAGGLGYVPITLTGLASPRGHHLSVNGKPLDQNVHGNDFWQTDYDPSTKTWSRTYNVRSSDTQPQTIEFHP
ncbi:hypothetical protein Pla22_22190 [Rubripirellula amarantea]|uniref:LamG-like jellyroll fold domain-containing protein n=1 Tax=Rubripirellula amarantea TaxID=2527999 RepID=A0A5C5WWI4_9BACT|nr:LamG domain-containing protein [Rubripirellula amarantea]TWT54569.1 hypothetical protein Pla22_22190 [Rubripirellula amarantea]